MAEKKHYFWIILFSKDTNVVMDGKVVILTGANSGIGKAS